MTRLKPERLLSTGYEAALPGEETLKEASPLLLRLQLLHEAQHPRRVLPLPGATLRLPVPPLREPAVRVALEALLLPCHRPSMVFQSGRVLSAELQRSI